MTPRKPRGCAEYSWRHIDLAVKPHLRDAMMVAITKMGGKYYLANKPCKRGHLGLRLTKNWTCCLCRTESRRVPADQKARPGPKPQEQSELKIERQREAKNSQQRDVYMATKPLRINRSTVY